MKTKLSMLAVLAAISAPAAAGTIDLGVASNYNVFVFDGYQGRNSIGGAVAVGGSANLSSSSISNTTDNAYALVVGNNLTKEWGNIGGTTWVGGSVTAPQWDWYNNYSTATASPVDFSAAKSQLTTLSNQLASASATGSVDYKYGTGGYLTGTNASIEYFNLSGSDLLSINNWTLNNIVSGATLILNIAGNSSSLSGGWTFGNYNVLLNFYEATTVNVGGISLDASILATHAQITGGSGTVNGTIVANAWNNNLDIGANNPFVAVTTLDNITAAVPEPHDYALLLAGLGVIGLTATRRKRVLARS